MAVNFNTRHSMTLKKAACTTVLLILTSISCIAAYPPQGWETDINRAVNRATNENKNLLINFAGSDWCGWCIKLEKEVFSTPLFKQYARQNLVLLFIDSPQQRKLPQALAKQNSSLRTMFGIQGFPTILMFSPDFTPLLKIGYEKGGPENYIKQLKTRRLPLTAEKKAKFRQLAATELKKRFGIDLQRKANVANKHVPAGWITSFAEAKKRATRENKEILMYFAGSDWCGWCIKLKKEVLSQAYFKNEAPKRYVLLFLDKPARYQQPEPLKTQIAALAKEYEIKGYPTLLILDAKGRQKAKTGYKAGGAEAYVNHLNKLFRIKWE